jgi:hypothetical protein
MTRLLRKYRRLKRRKRARKKFALAPMTPEAHAALLAEREADRIHRRSLRKTWAAEDAMHRTAAVLEGERRAALQKAAPRLCARELTHPQRDDV